MDPAGTGGPLGSYEQETAWVGVDNGSNGGGGGGGCSSFFRADSWVPTSFTNKYGSECLTNFVSPPRVLPDLSLNANTQEIIYQNGAFTGSGGTSIGAPELAGFFVLENSYLGKIAVKEGSCSRGQADECYYPLAGSSAPSSL